jgi:hypothetical protein
MPITATTIIISIEVNPLAGARARRRIAGRVIAVTIITNRRYRSGPAGLPFVGWQAPPIGRRTAWGRAQHAA